MILPDNRLVAFPALDGEGRIAWGTASQRPAAGPSTLASFYYATDTGQLSACTFTTTFAWVSVTIPAWAAVPASSGASGTAGQLAYDGSYLYICTATNTWVRFLRTDAAF